MNEKLKPLLIVVMGVSGCGKSTLAKSLAEKLDFKYLDADDFHSPENKRHMASGKPLTDAMRLPWVKSIKTTLEEKTRRNISCVLAFSGLKKAHREILKIHSAQQITLFLQGEKSLIQDRINRRAGHFMPTSLLNSQFESLEIPIGENQVFAIDISPEPESILKTSLKIIDSQREIFGGGSTT